MISSLGVTMRLAAVGVRDVSRGRPIVDETVETHSVGAVMVDVGWWYGDWWPKVLATARARQISVQVYVPDHVKPDDVSRIADEFGENPRLLLEQCADKLDRFEQEWRAMRDAGDLIAGSSFVLGAYTESPAGEMFWNDGGCILMPRPVFGAAGVREERIEPLVLTFSAKDGPAHEWLLEQMPRLTRARPVYSAEVR